MEYQELIETIIKESELSEEDIKIIENQIEYACKEAEQIKREENMNKITIDREYHDRMVDLLQRAEVRIMELQEELETALEVEETDLDFSALEELLKVEEVNPPDEEKENENKEIQTLESIVSR